MDLVKNVPEDKPLAEKLRMNKIIMDHQRHEMGTVAQFENIMGNSCTPEASGKFEQLILSNMS